MDRTLPRLVLLHGPGVGGEAFRFQRTLSARIETPPWLRYERNERLEDYARRMASTIEPGGDLVLAGLSFGGMVALEMAKLLRPRAVILIASGYSGHQVSLLFHPFQRFFKYLPMPVYRFGRWALLPFVRLAFRSYPRKVSDLIIEVVKHHVDFITWRRGIAAIADWTFQGTLDVPVYSIHGTKDWLMPLYRVPPPDEIIEGAPHLMNISHAGEVNEFLESHLTKGAAVKTAG